MKLKSERWVWSQTIKIATPFVDRTAITPPIKGQSPL
jgi:hypothetical protein